MTYFAGAIHNFQCKIYFVCERFCGRELLRRASLATEVMGALFLFLLPVSKSGYIVARSDFFPHGRGHHDVAGGVASQLGVGACVQRIHMPFRADMTYRFAMESEEPHKLCLHSRTAGMGG
jgi:hypothetical protein